LEGWHFAAGKMTGWCLKQAQPKPKQTIVSQSFVIPAQAGIGLLTL
jgi:hypothetical protein